MPKQGFWRQWWPPIGLILLTLVPMIAGISRVSSLAGGGPVNPENARFFAAPLPVLIHIVGATLYCILGALQFANAFRIRMPRWHRLTGRGLLVCGLAAALSGLWMTNFYALPEGLQGPILYTVRWLVGLGMAASLVLAWVTIVNKKPLAHRAWAIRAYALGQGAGTQVLVFVPFGIAGVPILGTSYDLLMTLAWLINATVAELIIRNNRPKQRTKSDQNHWAAVNTN